MVQIRQKQRRVEVLQLLREGLTEQRIADKLDYHRNTIVRDVRWLKQHIFYDWTLITNEIMEELQTRIGDMSDRDLIIFLSKLIPQKIESHTLQEVKVEAKHDIDLNVFSDDEKSILDKAAAILDRKSKGKSDSLH